MVAVLCGGRCGGGAAAGGGSTCGRGILRLRVQEEGRSQVCLPFAAPLMRHGLSIGVQLPASW